MSLLVGLLVKLLKENFLIFKAELHVYLMA